MSPMKKILWLSILIVLGPGALAQDAPSLASSAVADLKKAQDDLNATRQDIDAQRLPLARKLTDLERALADAKRQYSKAQRFQENLLVELNALKAEAKRRSEEVKFIDSLVTEYARSFRSRLNFIEEPRYAAMFEVVEKAGAAADKSVADKFAERTILFETSLQRNAGALGGEVFETKALDKQGRVTQGKAAVIGPVAMFAGASGDTAGLLQDVLNRDPTVVEVDKNVDEASRALVNSGSGQLALDATLGNAFKLSQLKESLFEKFAKGGLVMIPLLALGVAVLLVALFKWIQFSRFHLATERDLQMVLRHLDNGEKEDALTHTRTIKGPAGDLLTTAIEHVDEKKEYIEEILYEKMLGARTKLERGVPFLALAATAGPLMGLLGTVMGMIATFKLISSFGSGDPKLLAAGISEALIATATGMGVAIPALLLHAFLNRKAKGIIGSMEQSAVGFINGIPETEKTVFA